MNRRELLKFSLLAPLAGLFKKKKEPQISETTGTSSETKVVEFPFQFITPPEEKWVKLEFKDRCTVNGKDIKAGTGYDIPIGFWKVT